MSSRLNSHRKKFGPVAPTGEIQFSGVTDSGVRNALALIGQQLVELSKKDGTVLRGHFGGIENVAGQKHLVLRYASIKSGDPYALSSATERRGNVAEKVRIPISEFTKMEAPLPAVDHSSVTNNHGRGRAAPDSRSFATDGQIANRLSSGPGRELKKFDDFSEFPVVSNTPSSNAIRNGSRDAETFGDVRNPGKWDQFRANQEQFGVRTSFDESEYTTKIDRSSVDYPAREREAARIAAEIESKSSVNIHLQEERNQRLPADLDEEALYSGVQRQNPPAFQPLLTMNSRNKTVQNGGNLASHLAKTNVAKDQNLHYGPPKQDVRPRNGGPSKIPQKSAIPSKAVWGSKNNQSKNVTPFSKSVHVPKNHKLGGAKSGNPALKAEVSNPVPPTVGVKTPAPAPKASAPAAKASATLPKGAVNPPPPKAHAGATSKPTAIPKSTPATKKLSYAAAAGARVNRQAPPTASIPVDLTQGPRPPLSPMSPSKSNTVKPSNASGSSSVPRVATTRNHSAVRLPNGGRTPPTAARNSPNVTRTSPSNPETSAMDALNLEPRSPKIVKSFEQYKQDKVGKSLTEKRQEITNDFKKFSTDLDAKRGAPRKASSGLSVTPVKNEKQSVSTVSKAVSPVADTTTQNEKGTESVESKREITLQSSDGVAKKDTPKEVIESKAAVKKGTESGSTTSTRFKPVKKLNPNAASWQPTSAPANPAVSAPQPPNSHGVLTSSAQIQQHIPGPGAPSMDPYFHMNNFGGVAPNVAPGMAPEHQAPGYGFQMAPPVGHPANMPYGGYPSMIVPPGMPQNPTSFPYMAGTRTPYIMPGNGTRFPPGAPPGGMGFGIPVPMMPSQGNQRSPGMPQYYGPQYMASGQPPMPMQPAITPAYAHPQQVVAPHVPQPVVSPRNSMGGGSGGGSSGGSSRRSGSKGRSRHNHQHQQYFDSDQNQSQAQQQSTSNQSGYASAGIHQVHTGKAHWHSSGQSSKAPSMDESSSRDDLKNSQGSGKVSTASSGRSQAKPRQ